MKQSRVITIRWKILAVTSIVLLLALWLVQTWGGSTNVGSSPSRSAGTTSLEQKMDSSPPPFGYGVTVQLQGQPVTPLLNGVIGMHFNWVRQPLRWQDMELAAGQYDWSRLDPVVEEVNAKGLHLLLVIHGTAGAELSRNGPPAELDAWVNFVTALAGRYAGRVDAYQIYQDPNLSANWVSPQAYVQLLQAAYQAIKSASPEAKIVSAGLYPGATEDGLAAMSDVEYLAGIRQAGGANWYDVLGVHLVGVGNGDDLDYHALQQDNESPIWLTQVGWACPLAAQEAAGECEEQQAAFLIRAFEMAEKAPAIQVVMVDNFNLSTVTPSDPAADFSLIRADWSARPAFLQLAQMRQEQVPTPDG